MKQKLVATIALSSFFLFQSTIMAQDQFKLLVYTILDDWHSNCIPEAINAFKKLSKKNQFKFEWTQRPDEILKKLPEYDVLVFINANADSLKQKHLDGLKTFINKGGGFVGIHAAASGKIRKPWFDGLIGGVFVNHPQFQAAIVQVEDDDFPATWHLQKKWLWSDEWYNFTAINVDSLNIVLSVDETSYDFTLGYDDKRLKGMGEKHPIAWAHEYERGKVFYTALGHKPEAYKNDDFIQHILGGIYWVLKK